MRIRSLTYALALSLLTACNLPHDWNESGGVHDPFGADIFCTVLDSAGLQTTLSRCVSDTLQTQDPPHTLMIWRFGGDSIPTDSHYRMAGDYARQGYHVLLASDTFPGLQTAGSRFCIDSLVAETEKLRGFKRLDSLTNLGKFPHVLCSAGGLTDCHPDILFDIDSYDVRSWIDGNSSYCRMQVGDGTVSICTTPLLLTNYGILYDHDLSENLLRLLQSDSEIEEIVYCNPARSGHQLYTCPIKKPKADKRYPLPEKKSPQWRWKNELKQVLWWLAIGLYLLFLLFYARRRQRVIPVMETPRNRTLDFARQAAAVYLMDQDYPALLRKQKAVLQSEAQNRAHIRLAGRDTSAENLQRLAVATGIPQKRLRWILETIDGDIDGARELGIDELMDQIDNIQLIINKLKQ